MLRLTIFGRFSLVGADGTQIPLKSQKAKALLAYLALSPDKTRSREEIMALLWSDRGDAQARASLRQMLFGLKKTLNDEAPDALRITDDVVSLNPEHIIVESGKAGAELLSGFHLNDPAFEEWIRDERLRQEDKQLFVQVDISNITTDKPSIAVLPFTNLSGDPEQGYLSDGISEDIITALSKLSDVFVVARESTFIYKDKAVEVKQVGQEQGVRYVLEGSVRRSGERMRVSAQLIEAETGNHIWAERYDRVVNDVFALQDEITREVTSALQVELTDGEQAKLWAGGTDNIEAWELILQVREYINGHRREDQPKALKMVEKALSLDDNYSSAWSMLGWFHYQAVFNGWTDTPEESIKEALHAAQRAESLNDANSDTYNLLAFIHLSRGDYAAASSLSEKAMTIGPSSSLAFAVAANVALFKNQPNDMIPLIEKAMRLSPTFPAWYQGDLAWAYLLLTQLEKSIAIANEAVKNDPNYIYTYCVLAIAHAELGNEEKAQEAVANILRIEPKYTCRTFAETQPFRDADVINRQTNGLRKAGLLNGQEQPSSSSKNKPSVAILPFTNMSGDPEQEYFSDGITEDIITELSRFESLFVITSNSSFTFKDQDVQPDEIGEKLGVQFVVQGTVRKSGRRLRITVQLIETETGKHLWSEKYDRELEDIFDVQDEVASRVATMVPGHVDIAKRNQSERKPANDVNAYDLYLRADWRFQHNFGSQEGMQLIQDALKIDPNYAEAHAMYALQCAYRMFISDTHADEAVKLTNTHGDLAATLAPGDALVRAMLGEAYLLIGEHALAAHHIDKALALNSNGFHILVHSALVRAYTGEYDVGYEMIERAMQNDPFSTPVIRETKLEICFLAGLYEEALQQLVGWPDPPLHIHLSASAALAQLGRIEEAKSEFQRVENEQPENWNTQDVVKAYQRMCLLPEDAERWMDGFRKAGLKD